MLKSSQINRVQNMPEFWMCLMKYRAKGHFTNYWTVIAVLAYLEHCQTFKMERFAKRIMSECRYTTIYFSGQGRVRGTRALQAFLQKHKNKKEPIDGHNHGLFPKTRALFSIS